MKPDSDQMPIFHKELSDALAVFSASSRTIESVAVMAISDLGDAHKEIERLEDLVTSLRQTSSFVLEQLEMGNWIDDHGHRVEMNQAIQELRLALSAAEGGA